MSTSRSTGLEPEWREASLTVPGVHGLQARPAIRFSRAARAYAARIQVRTDEAAHWVDAKSVAKVMSLQVESGRTIRLRAHGIDADAALGGLRQLVENELANDSEDAG